MRSLRSRSLAAMVLIGSLVACKHEGAGGGSAGLPAEMQPRPAHGDPAKLEIPAVLAHVPADTPYLLAGLDAMPPELFDKLKQAVMPLSGLITGAWQREREHNKVFDAVLGELDGKWNDAGLESLGLSAHPRFAIYGLGLQPMVARLAVKDHKVVQATIERIAAKAGEPLPAMATKDGRNYWRHDSGDGVSVVLALADNQVVFSVGKAADVDAKLGLILGIDKPAKSMADGALVKQLMARHGLGGQLIGFVDSRQLAGKALEAAGAAPTAACTTELDQLAAVMPRVVFGYGELSATRMSSGIVFELAPGAVAALRLIQSEVPGLAAVLAGHPLFAMAGGVDLGRAQLLGGLVANRLKQFGTTCALGPLVDGATQAAAALARPLPEPAGRIAGGAMVIDDIAFAAAGQAPPSMLPSKVDGMILIASPDARALFTKLGELEPSFKQFGLVADGKLHPVASPMPLPFTVSAGVGERAIILTTGDARRAVAEQQLTAKSGDKAPLMAVTYQIGKLLDLGMQSGGLNSNAMEPGALAFMQQIKNVFGQLTGTLDVTDQGLALWTTFELK